MIWSIPLFSESNLPTIEILSKMLEFAICLRMVVFNSSGYLEIAVYKSDNATVGSASSLMGLKIRDTVTVNFEKV